MSEPKFKPGDIVIARGSEGYFPEREVISVSEDGSELRFDGILCGVASYGYDLVFRPATREETEALRRVAKAAETVIDTIEQKSKDACRIYSGEGSVLFEHKDILAAIKAYRLEVAGAEKRRTKRTGSYRQW